MTDGETYYTVVRATNALNLAITIRSDGITIKRDPLIPGQVYDGPLEGFDLTYQKETDTISASWSGFGQGIPVKETVEHTGKMIYKKLSLIVDIIIILISYSFFAHKFVLNSKNRLPAKLPSNVYFAI